MKALRALMQMAFIHIILLSQFGQFIFAKAEKCIDSFGRMKHAKSSNQNY